MAIIAYYRVSTGEQTIESQRNESNGRVFDREYSDVGVSGTVPALERPQFKSMFDYVREGDELWVYDVDRLGRDSIDVQIVVKALKEKRVSVYVKTLGMDLTSDASEIVLLLLSKLAEMERRKILARTKAGREAAVKAGKKMGAPTKFTPDMVMACRRKGLSINATAAKLGCSVATVKRLQKEAKAQEVTG
ncbi:recombinase family protein [Vibrio brasiliensis]|uniref:recombinase family protein n=1 Tax=Vibrio brasiliensis TaxID=170652 RepID=UPI001EFEC0D6|nr:recombinase family protein [Vibrio brasiliensis]MCG9784174.1 recombinase family protein [Vibrio brasiliensis]